jgi:hypothetical protein
MAVVYSDQLRLDADKHAKLNSGDSLAIRGKCDGAIFEIPHSSSGNMVALTPGASGWATIIGHDWGADACRVSPGYVGPGFEFRDSLFAIHARPGGTAQHQDGIQTGGGNKVTWTRCLIITYVDSTQGAFFQGFSGGAPTDCVLVDSVIAGNWTSTVVAGDGSTRCGARHCLLQHGKTYDFRKKVTSFVDEGNKFVAATDPVLQECVRTLSAAPWAGGTVPPLPPPTEPPPAPDPVPPPDLPDPIKVDRMWDEMLSHGWTP